MDRLIKNRIFTSPQSILLLGPRQVGKSTLCRELKPGLIIDLADEEAFLSHSKDPGLIKREMEALLKPTLVLVDEIQRIPALLNSIQALLDQKKGHRFLLTGSSARKLKRGGANLLPGRIVIEYLDPLSIWELGTAFNLEKALQGGTLPGIYLDERSGADVLESYANIYLRSEIQAEALTKNIGAYARFLDAAAAASGDWINYSKFSRDAEISKETLRRFYCILEETMVAFRIPAFKPKSSTRKVSQRDRFIFFDLGVRNAILGLNRHPASPAEKGKLFEQWVILQCLSWIHSQKKSWKAASYRTDAGAEVDIVMDTGDKLLAIECKYGRNVSEADLRGLRSFEEVAHKGVVKYVLYQGSRKQKFSKGELAIPYQEFLLEVLPSF